MSAESSWVRDLVEFALDRDISEEIEAQLGILREYPELASAHFNLGVLYYSQRRLEDSIREYLMAIECDPTMGKAYRKLGEIYVGLDDCKQAGRYAVMAAERGDSALLDAFRRYPLMRQFVEVEEE
ncbi:MAG TPA: tetratricopeptide repeat protein [Blastocatellia bacterium]|nr:tetratricopeptide repeat protein [Blastocatellia bacterium]